MSTNVFVVSTVPFPISIPPIHSSANDRSCNDDVDWEHDLHEEVSSPREEIERNLSAYRPTHPSPLSNTSLIHILTMASGSYNSFFLSFTAG